MKSAASDHALLIRIYPHLFNIQKGKYLETTFPIIQYLFESLHKPVSRKVLGPKTLESTIHLVHRLLAAIHLGVVHPISKDLRKSRYSTKVHYHLERLGFSLSNYFFSLCCIKDVHKNLHQFQRDEVGFSQYAEFEDGAKGGEVDSEGVTFSNSRVDFGEGRFEKNQNLDPKGLKDVDPDSVNRVPLKEGEKDPYQAIRDLEREFYEHGLDPKEEGIKFDYPKWRLRKGKRESNRSQEGQVAEGGEEGEEETGEGRTRGRAQERQTQGDVGQHPGRKSRGASAKQVLHFGDPQVPLLALDHELYVRNRPFLRTDQLGQLLALPGFLGSYQAGIREPDSRKQASAFEDPL